MGISRNITECTLEKNHINAMYVINRSSEVESVPGTDADTLHRNQSSEYDQTRNMRSSQLTEEVFGCMLIVK
jgi:hypothetical protein